VYVIVMVASEMENGREKCYQYWPEDLPLEFELLHVSRNSYNKTPEQVICRYFTLTEKATQKTRIVSQFQTVGWPDQGLPDTADGLKRAIELADSDNREGSPLVVHCSAGIGRTGVYCVVHSVWTKLKLLLSSSLATSVDIKEVVLKLREHRAGMVQTVEQYIFVYMSLNEKLNDLLKLLNYKNEKWFHKTLDSNQANQLLQHKPHGSFVFRASSVPGFLVLSAVSGKNVLHARISVSEKGFGLEQDTYPSLSALVDSRRQILVHPILRTSSK
jgi:protein-tyrosine phosphatase